MQTDSHVNQGLREVRLLWVQDPIKKSRSHKEAYQALAEVAKAHMCELILASVEQAKSLLGDDCAAVIIEPHAHLTDEIDFLSHVKEVAPAAGRFIAAESESCARAVTLINRVGVTGVIDWSCPIDITHWLATSIQTFRGEFSRQLLYREAKSQNLKLTEMTESLERLVAERTEHTEQAKIEVERNVARMRGLIRFVKELSGCLAVEELFLLIRSELKHFHRVKSPYLGYLRSDQIRRILYFQGTQIHGLQVKKTWSNSPRLRVNDLHDGTYLANQFGRPFAKTIAIPLIVRKISEDAVSVPAVLYFEHSLNKQEEATFINFVSERLQPLSIALDRLLLEFDLKTASLIWERTFDGIVDPVAIMDVDYNLLRSNKSFRRAVGNKCYQQFDGRDKTCRSCPLPTAIERGEHHVEQVSRGESVYRVHSYPISFGEGTLPTTVVNHYVDVSKAFALQSQIIQNEKMAALGHLAGNIAHELNNPLTGIRSLSQILLQDVDSGDEKYSDLLEVEKAAERCQLIINNLLEFSQGEQSHKAKRVKLNDIVNRTLPLLKTAMRSFNSEIELTENDTWVRVEPQLMQQVVFNIVNNACQAMASGGKITIRTEIIVPGQWIRLTVGDTGEGISSEIQAKIFDPFFTTKAEGKGTGLGLSMSRNVIEQFGGSIKVESQQGEGSRFYIELPWAGEHEDSSHR